MKWFGCVEMVLKLCLTFLVAFVGAKVALKLKVPAGAMIGSLFFVSIFSVFTGMGYFPISVKTMTQAVAGAFIGISVQRKDIQELKQIILPSLFFLVGIFVISLGMGYTMFRFTSVDAPTSFLACVPAGIMDISLISHDLGANGPEVAVLQIVRLIVAIGITPMISKSIITRLGKGKSLQNEGQTGIKSEEKTKDKANDCTNKKQKIVLTTITTVVGGVLGYLAGIPAGAMTFAMIFVAVLSVKFDKAYMPQSIRVTAQMFAGALIGVTVTMDSILQLKRLMIPALIIVVGCIVINYGLGFLIARFSKIDLATMLFASTPAGVSDMALIAMEVGGDPPKVVAMQLVRFIGILTFMPSIVKYLVSVLT